MDAQQLYDLLQALGVDLSSIRAEQLESCFSETVVLRKFDGDGPVDRTDEPVETVVIKDGKIMEIDKCHS